MKNWWHKKKSMMRKNRKSSSDYTFIDFMLDVLIWIPELFLFPLRLIFWIVRGIGKFILDSF